MGFHAFNAGGPALTPTSGYSRNLLHQCECTVCPLNHAAGLLHPKMPAAGAARPLAFILGEAPGREEDRAGVPFIGPSGELLRRYLPREWLALVRWGNTIRCLPRERPKDAIGAPTEVMTECCRPSIERDIVAAAPAAILGFGSTPLGWAAAVPGGVLAWCGRRLPVSIGGHVCWYYPLMHPAYVLREQGRGSYGRELEATFARQLAHALQEIRQGLPPPAVHDPAQATAGTTWITGSEGDRDLHRFATFLHALAEERIVGFDYETTGVRPYARGSKLLSVAVAGREQSLAVALEHPQTAWNSKQRDEVYRMLAHFIRSRTGKRRLVAHHLPFELEWSAYHFGSQLIWGSAWGDTESQAYILDERPFTFSLDFLCWQYFGLSIKALNNLDRDSLAAAPLVDVLRYNAVDAKYHRLTFLAQERRLKQEQLTAVYAHQLERTIAMIPSQLRGLPVDFEYNVQLRTTYERRLAKVEKQLAEHRNGVAYRNRTSKPYRPSALEDTRRYLVAIAGRREFSDRTKPVSESSLRGIDDPVIKLTLRWRKLHKILSTYILPISRDSPHIYPDGRLHPIVATTRTRTWRTSSLEPNSQNWPKRDLTAMAARRQIYPGPDYRVVAFDYAGIQARNIAMESRDATLVRAFFDHYDIHQDWMERIARLVPGWLPKKADGKTLKQYRHKAKNGLVFPSFFGASSTKVATEIGISERQAAQLHEEFWEMFPAVRGWHQRVMADYRRTGYVTGLSGFRRRAPISPNELINAPIQADESLIVCRAMVRLSQRGIIHAMEIHDDLTFLIPQQKIDPLAEQIISEMLRVEYDWINVPLSVEMAVGRDWGSMEEVGKYESVGRDRWRQLP